MYSPQLRHCHACTVTFEFSRLVEFPTAKTRSIAKTLLCFSRVYQKASVVTSGRIWRCRCWVRVIISIWVTVRVRVWRERVRRVLLCVGFHKGCPRKFRSTKRLPLLALLHRRIWRRRYWIRVIIRVRGAANPVLHLCLPHGTYRLPATNGSGGISSSSGRKYHL